MEVLTGPPTGGDSSGPTATSGTSPPGTSSPRSALRSVQ